MQCWPSNLHSSCGGVGSKWIRTMFVTNTIVRWSQRTWACRRNNAWKSLLDTWLMSALRARRRFLCFVREIQWVATQLSYELPVYPKCRGWKVIFDHREIDGLLELAVEQYELLLVDWMHCHALARCAARSEYFLRCAVCFVQWGCFQIASQTFAEILLLCCQHKRTSRLPCLLSRVVQTIALRSSLRAQTEFVVGDSEENLAHHDEVLTYMYMRWRELFQLRWSESNGECGRIGQGALSVDVGEWPK